MRKVEVVGLVDQERSPGRLRTVLFCLHDEGDSPGLLGDWAKRRGFAVEMLHVADTQDFPDPRGFDLIVPLGSVASVADPDVPFLAGERTFVREAVDCDVPVLGVCFGGQLLASALGAEVCAAQRHEVGWYTLRTLDPGLIPAGPWFQWHVDCFSVPRGATLLAEANDMAQGFRLDRHVGLQFHPEVTPDIVATWAEHGQEQLRALGVDVDSLLERTQREGTAARERALHLFDRLATVLFGSD